MILFNLLLYIIILFNSKNKFPDEVNLIYKINTSINIFSLQIVLIYYLNVYLFLFHLFLIFVLLKCFIFSLFDSEIIKKIILEFKNYIFDELYSKYYDNSSSLFQILKSKIDLLKRKPYFQTLFNFAIL